MAAAVSFGASPRGVPGREPLLRGVALALIFFLTVKEPERGGKEAEKEKPATAKAGCVAVGDVLVGVTAVRYPGSAYLGAAKPERDIFPAHEMNFDTVVEAISSNEPPECDDVILRLRRAA